MTLTTTTDETFATPDIYIVALQVAANEYLDRASSRYECLGFMIVRSRYAIVVYVTIKLPYGKLAFFFPNCKVSGRECSD